MATTYLTVRQSMKRGMMPAADPSNPMGQSQKYMAYIMPFFALSGLYWPFGLVLYWVTTNLWTLGQQYVLFMRFPTPATAAAGATGGVISPSPALAPKTRPAQPGPGRAVPGRTPSAKAPPAKAAPGKTVTGKAVPGKAVPGKAGPGKTVPGKTVPGKAGTAAGPSGPRRQDQPSRARPQAVRGAKSRPVGQLGEWRERQRERQLKWQFRGQRYWPAASAGQEPPRAGSRAGGTRG
jgi:hypothetical protein